MSESQTNPGGVDRPGDHNPTTPEVAVPAAPDATRELPTGAAAQPYGTGQPYGAAQPYGHQPPYGGTYPGPGGAPPYPPAPGWTPPLGAGAHPVGPQWPFRRSVVAGVAALAIALTAGGVGGFVGYALHPDSSPLQVAADTGNGNAAPVVDRSSLSSIAAALQPAIVDVKTSAGEGSGVVISADGHIATNNHVLEGAQSGSVSVTFNSGRQVPAEVVGTDPATDLAVLKVDAENLTFAAWGDSESVQVGDTVLAIGSPLGLQGSVTAGIVSALNRTITVGGDQQSPFETGDTTTIGAAIQTDAPINPGNSGGALVNMRGEVIGINTAIASENGGNIGVGFAISSNRAKAVTDALIAGEEVGHPYLGVQISNAPDGGARVDGVEEGSPAEQAGIEVGDVVTQVGDQPVRGAEDLIGVIQASTVGQSLPVTIQRGGSEQTVTVTIGEQ